MSPIALLILITTSVALFLVKRRLAPVPLLIGACYMTQDQGFEIANLNFYFIRMLLWIGLLRIIIKRERPLGLMLGMDWAFIAWSIWAISASLFYKNPSVIFKNRLGMIYNALGIYFLIRSFCNTEEDVRKLIQVICWLLLPVSLFMFYEHLTNYNIFSILGGVQAESLIREGRIRAQGPFAHSILAGTVGGVCIPIIIGILRYHPLSAYVGIAACLGMVIFSVSGGPIISVISGLFAIFIWRWRHVTKYLLIAAGFVYIFLELVMKAPAYYLIARINIGESRAYHRAAIIESAITYFNEWWFVGTDYTRHWIPYGVPWSQEHADITNHYIGQGVKGGLLLMLLFIFIFGIGFYYIKIIVKLWSQESLSRKFFAWSLGASLFAHAISCLGVAYYDQSILFLYLTFAMVANLYAVSTQQRQRVAEYKN